MAATFLTVDVVVVEGGASCDCTNNAGIVASLQIFELESRWH
jgi:hypothetical protein